MTAISGRDFYATWVWSGGTIVLSTDYRDYTPAPSVDMLDASAGADAHKEYLAGIKDTTYAFNGIRDSADTLGTALLPGVAGTLTVGEFGTATGKIKLVHPCYSLGLITKTQYNSVVEYSVTFQANGTVTLGVW